MPPVHPELMRLLLIVLLALTVAGCSNGGTSSEYEREVRRCVEHQLDQGFDMEAALAICE